MAEAVLAVPPAAIAAAGTGRSPAAGGVRMAAALRVALVCTVVGQLGRIPVLQAGKKDAPVLVNDLFLALLVFAAALVALRTRRLVVDRVSLAALAWAGVGGLSALLAMPRFGLSVGELLFSLAYLARWLAYFAVYLVTINFVEAGEVPRVWRAFSAAIVAFTAFGVLQAIFLPSFAQLVYPDSTLLDWDNQGHRLISTVLDPNFAGAMINLVLLPSLAMLAYGVRQSPWKLGLLFAGLALTLSRGAILSFAVGMLVLLSARGLSRRLLRAAALLPLAVLPLVPMIVRYALAYNKVGFADRSAMSRVQGWLLAIRYFGENPVLGVGFNTFGFVQAHDSNGLGAVITRASFGMDGGLLEVAALTGLLGLACYLWMLWAGVRNARAVWRDADAPAESRGLAVGVAAATVCIVVHGFFLNTLFYPFLMEPLWVMWGLVALLRPARSTETVAERRGTRLRLAQLGAAPAPGGGAW
jgi:hypothetical protein